MNYDIKLKLQDETFGDFMSSLVEIQYTKLHYCTLYNVFVCHCEPG